MLVLDGAVGRRAPPEGIAGDWVRGVSVVEKELRAEPPGFGD